MEFRNRTPFPALRFASVDVQDQEHHVVVMRLSYRLQRNAEASSATRDAFDACIVERDAPPLVLADEYAGDPETSSTRQESDLAPFKPRCDVLVNAVAHAPGGVPSTQWVVRLRVSERVDATVSDPRQRAQAEPETYLVDKTLRVHGPRDIRLGVSGWTLGPARETRSVAVDYEHALGGLCRVINPDASATGAPAYLLNEACYSNPAGRGWIERRYESALRKTGRGIPQALPGPQIDDPRQPLRDVILAHNPAAPVDARGMAEVAARYGAAPAGFGGIGRAWAPRLQRAGSYDDAWLHERWPKLPHDFSFAYWNCAPDDQQIPHPADGGLRLELDHLVAPGLAPSGRIVVELPPYRAFVLARFNNGVMHPIPMRVDTVIVDTQAMTLAQVWRISLPVSLPLRVLEARLETDPAAPLLRVKPRSPHPPVPATQQG